MKPDPLTFATVTSIRFRFLQSSITLLRLSSEMLIMFARRFSAAGNETASSGVTYTTLRSSIFKTKQQKKQVLILFYFFKRNWATVVSYCFLFFSGSAFERVCGNRIARRIG